MTDADEDMVRIPVADNANHNNLQGLDELRQVVVDTVGRDGPDNTERGYDVTINEGC